jgi:hypothetical protein
VAAYSGDCCHHLYVAFRSEIQRVNYVRRGILVTDRLSGRWNAAYRGSCNRLGMGPHAGLVNVGDVPQFCSPNPTAKTSLIDESPFTPLGLGTLVCRLESPASSLNGLRNRTLGEGCLRPAPVTRERQVTL